MNISAKHLKNLQLNKYRSLAVDVTLVHYDVVS